MKLTACLLTVSSLMGVLVSAQEWSSRVNLTNLVIERDPDSFNDICHGQNIMCITGTPDAVPYILRKDVTYSPRISKNVKVIGQAGTEKKSTEKFAVPLGSYVTVRCPNDDALAFVYDVTGQVSVYPPKGQEAGYVNINVEGSSVKRRGEFLIPNGEFKDVTLNCTNNDGF